MYKLASDAGVRFSFDSEVVTLHPHESSVILSSGEIVYGDIIIGADGSRSIVRRYLNPENEEDGSHSCVMSVLVKRKDSCLNSNLFEFFLPGSQCQCLK